jgi:hypothetical protein
VLGGSGRRGVAGALWHWPGRGGAGRDGAARPSAIPSMSDARSGGGLSTRGCGGPVVAGLAAVHRLVAMEVRRDGEGGADQGRGGVSDRRRPARTSSAAPLLGGARRLGGRGSLVARGAAAGDGLGGARSHRRRRSWRREEPLPAMVLAAQGGERAGGDARKTRSRMRCGGKWDLGRLTPVGLGPRAGRGAGFSGRGELGRDEKLVLSFAVGQGREGIFVRGGQG